MKNLVKGSFDWHNTVNQNFQEISASLLEKANQSDVAQLSNPNLLINGDFKNPVNQRGATTYTASGWGTTYTIDRWILYNNGLVLTVGSGGISVNGDSFVINRLEKKDYKKLIGKTITLSVKYVGSVADVNNPPVTVVMYDRLSSTSAQVNTIKSKGTIDSDSNNHIYFCTIENFQANDVDYLEFVISTKSGYILEWAKLELSDKSTPFMPRLYAEELSLCQRYYEAFSYNKTFATGVVTSTTTAEFCFKFSTKRIAPTILYGAQNGFGVWTGVVGVATTAITTLTSELSLCTLKATVSGGLTIGNGALLQRNDSSIGSVYLDSEIY